MLRVNARDSRSCIAFLNATDRLPFSTSASATFLTAWFSSFAFLMPTLCCKVSLFAAYEAIPKFGAVTFVSFTAFDASLSVPCLTSFLAAFRVHPFSS